MISIDINTLDLVEFTGKEDQQQHCKATFPLIGAHGSKQLATVYFEIEPGNNLGRHTDSAEELIIVLEGTLEASVGNERGVVNAGSITLIPEMIPHDFRNTGTTTARILGVFGGKNNIVATFEKEWLPTNSNVVNTALLG
jgi:quercetin dioxygenase-like cupin family protein